MYINQHKFSMIDKIQKIDRLYLLSLQIIRIHIVNYEFQILKC